MSSKPNMVITLYHGLRSDALDDSHCWPLQTLNLNKMIERGIRLEAVSACTADDGGMVSLLTGQHARQHGYISQHSRSASSNGNGRLVSETFVQRLAEAGYHVAGVGCVEKIKPWLAQSVQVNPLSSIETAGCEYLATTQAKGLNSALLQQRQQRQRYGLFDPDRLLMDVEDDIDGFISIKMRQMLEKMPKDKPWALIAIFTGPANDLPPPTLFDYVTDPVLLEEGFVPADLTHLDVLAELDYPRVLLQRLEPQGIGRIRADYLGRVSLIDYILGRLMSAVEDRTDSDRTWVIVGSDRGQLLGEHGLVGHRSFLSGAVDVPIMIVPPSPVSQKLYPDLVSSIDLAATISALGGCDLPEGIAGRSLLPLVKNQPLALRSWPGSICEFDQRLMLETERYKAVFDTDRHSTIGLFNRLNDPDERENLVDTPVAHDVLSSLRGRLSDMLMGIRAIPRS